MIIMVEYKIQDIEGTFNGEIVKNFGNSEYIIKIDDTEHNLKVLDMGIRGVEFILNQRYHKIKYLETTKTQMTMSVDGVNIVVNLHPSLDEIVYKNSGGGGGASMQTALKSQIPGKVVQVAVGVGDSVKKGDVICTLESMKMQVGIKSHRDGTVQSIKVKEGDSVAKSDIVAQIE